MLQISPHDSYRILRNSDGIEQEPYKLFSQNSSPWVRIFIEREREQHQIMDQARRDLEASIAAGTSHAVIQDRMADCQRQMDKCHDCVNATNDADESQWNTDLDDGVSRQ